MCSSDLVKKFKKVLSNLLGIEGFDDPNSQVSKEMSQMEARMKRVDDMCDSLGPSVVEGENGEISVDSLDTVCGSLMDQLRSSSDYDDYIHNDVVKYLQDYKNRHPGEKIDRRKLKALIGCCIKGAMLRNEMNSKDENTSRIARTYLSLTLTMGGAAADESALSARSLQYRDLIVCRQNDLFTPLRDWIHGRGNFTGNISPNGRSLTINNPDGERIGYESRVTDSGNVVHHSAAGKTSLERSANRASKEPIKASTEYHDDSIFSNEELILEHLIDQKLLLEKLIKSISKGV